jgi:hypothetical protein
LPNEPHWLSSETVVEINQAVVSITGEPHFVRDRGLLESALVRPQNAFAYGEEHSPMVRKMSLRSLCGCLPGLRERTHFLKETSALAL